MATKLMVSLILMTTVKCGNYDESEFAVNSITLMSNYPFDNAGTLNTETMKNVSFYCFAKFNCSKTYCGELLPQIQWFLPRELREYELLYEPKDIRIEFSKQTTDWCNNETTFLIRSGMHINDIGFIHSGSYRCSHDTLGINSDFSVKIKGMASEAKCDFNDQCKSYNCHNKQCKCNEDKQVFIEQQNTCLSASNWNNSCLYDEQCSHMKPKDTTKCINNLCACNKGYIPVVVPMRGKTCSKISSLEGECFENEQCSESDSFCTIKNKCDCKDGYHLVNYNNTKSCIPNKKCDSSKLGFNYDFIRGDCNVNQFCRSNVCLCSLNYTETHSGDCIQTNFNETQDHPWIGQPRDANIKQHEQLVNQTIAHKDDIKVIFFGDSITAEWAGYGKEIWDKYYVPRHAYNYGIGDDRTEHLIWRIENKEFDGIKAKVVVLEIGTNNLDAEKNTAEDIAHGIKEIVNQLLVKMPSTKILLLGIIPRSGTIETKVQAVNTIISKYNDDKQVFYLDMSDKFKEKAGLYVDTVHLTKEGYQVWYETMEPLFKKLYSSE